MKDVFCPYCKQRAEYVDSIAVYRKSYGMIYLCRPCDAYVGVHKGTDKPLGTLANAELRGWRMRAHAAFDPLWKTGKMNRRKAYQRLQAIMELPRDQTHIALFTVAQCRKVVQYFVDAQRPEECHEY